MRATVFVLALALAGCRGARSAPAAAGVMRSRADTADVLEAVWRVPAHPYTGAGVPWFYLPDADSAAVTTSAAVRDLLARRGIPASARLPVGHDTVVYRVRGWNRDSTGAEVLELHSVWTRASANAPGGCILGGNVENFRVSRTPAGWEAERTRQGVHGVAYCRPRGRPP